MKKRHIFRKNMDVHEKADKFRMNLRGLSDNLDSIESKLFTKNKFAEKQLYFYNEYLVRSFGHWNV